MPKPISKTTKPVRRRSRAAAPSLPYEDWLIESLKDRKEAAAYLEAVLEEGDQAAIMLALRHVARAHGSVAVVAPRQAHARGNRRAAPKFT